MLETVLIYLDYSVNLAAQNAIKQKNLSKRSLKKLRVPPPWKKLQICWRLHPMASSAPHPSLLTIRLNVRVKCQKKIILKHGWIDDICLMKKSIKEKQGLCD